LQLLNETQTQVEQMGEQWRAAELYRGKGELLLRRGADLDSILESETLFLKALALAQQQQAKSLELRAAMSLFRLWQSTGRSDKGRQLLAPIYAWFTEGFGTADLQEAAALLGSSG
jgi:predicted ATPase